MSSENPETPSESLTKVPEQSNVANSIAAATRLATADPLNTEFHYYSSVLRFLAPALTKEVDRRNIIPWIRKLFRPEYHSSKLREKRNKYIAYLTTSLLLDEVVGIFLKPPADGALPDLALMQVRPVPAAQWETDNMWQDTLGNLPGDFQCLECYVHKDWNECRKDHTFDKILDQEFQFFLYIAKPYAASISGGLERSRAAAWLQALCSIHGHDYCSQMKAMRNDYMMALLGYIQDLRVVGPFAQFPSYYHPSMLKPLAETAKLATENSPITDPTGCYANDFLAEQPMPDDGAFCYIALSGNLVSSNIIRQN